MIVRAFSRIEATNILFFDSPVISIRDKGSKKALIHSSNVLFVEANDEKEEDAISDESAKEIAEFVCKNKDSELFFVNCVFGVSRSSAVAKAICDHFGIDFKNPSVYDGEWGWVQKYAPNPMVYQKVREYLREFKC